MMMMIMMMNETPTRTDSIYPITTVMTIMMIIMIVVMIIMIMIMTMTESSPAGLYFHLREVSCDECVDVVVERLAPHVVQGEHLLDNLADLK